MVRWLLGAVGLPARPVITRLAGEGTSGLGTGAAMSSAPTGDPARSLPLHHLALGTTEVEGLARFYREVFGLEETARQLDAKGGLRSIWLDLGGALLMIERCGDPPRRVELGRGSHSADRTRNRHAPRGAGLGPPR